MNNSLDTSGLQPRMISIRDLRVRLMPLIAGWKWAEDAIVDFWKLGAPDPQYCVCPMMPKCPELQCPHVKRVFLPAQFAKWWQEVAVRQGHDLKAAQALQVGDGNASRSSKRRHHRAARR